MLVLIDALQSLTTYLELPDMLKIAGVKPATTKKADMVDALNRYLDNRQNIINIWQRLSPFEKEMLEEYIRANGKLDTYQIKDICLKHKVKYTNSYYNNGLCTHFEEYSRARLYFIKGTMPYEIFETLKTLVKPVEFTFAPRAILDPEKIDKEKYDAIITIGETFARDFTNFIRLLNQVKLKITPKNLLPGKPAVVKINQALENKEPLLSPWEDIGDIKSIGNTTLIYGRSMLLQEAGLAGINSNELVLGEKAEKFLTSNTVEKCKMLFNAYTGSKRINELERIRELKVRAEGYYSTRLSTCRKTVLNYIIKLPVNKWVELAEIQQAMKNNHRNFVSKAVGEIMVYDEYDKQYFSRYNDDWLQIEGGVIEVIILEYLAVMGIVDVALEETETDEGEPYFYPALVRLTPLGAHILGINKAYTCAESTSNNSGSSGFTVQPNYEIIISEGSMKYVHALFFDRFAEKVAEDQANIYKLSFKAMVTALDNGNDITEIIEYLDKHSQHPLPDNVRLTLQGWQKASKKIKIRTVTVIETDDKYLIEELKSYKAINKYIVNEVPHVFEINNKDINKVKREIEKKNHFCSLE